MYVTQLYQLAGAPRGTSYPGKPEEGAITEADLISQGVVVDEYSEYLQQAATNLPAPLSVLKFSRALYRSLKPTSHGPRAFQGHSVDDLEALPGIRL